MFVKMFQQPQFKEEKETDEINVNKILYLT